MGADDTIERLARIEALMSGMQAEMVAMREALIRLVRIEEQHASTREDLIRQHDRIDRQDERLDAVEQAVASVRGPLLWLSGIAATVVAGLVSVILGRVL